MQTYRKGDVVSVQGTVEYDHEGDELLFFKVPGYFQSVSLMPNQWDGANLKLVQAALEVGDGVMWDNGERSGEILAIANGHAWIDMGGGDYCTRLLTAIDRIPNYVKEPQS